jgi:hypothetical protein
VCVLHRYTSYLRRVGYLYLPNLSTSSPKDDNNIFLIVAPIQRPSGGLSHAIDSNSPK